jgi:ubiquinone/menaquinone biosynthesis C-methylase UbiE
MPSQRELFEHRYQQISKTDRVGWSDEESLPVTLETLHRLVAQNSMKSGNLIELGCGRGNIALSFADHWRVTGVDFSATAIDWARELAEKVVQQAEFIVADLVQPWPFDHLSFDVAIDANCLHFFHGDARIHFIREAHRILKPNGALIVNTIVGQPEEQHWELLNYDLNSRSTFKDGVKMNYYAEIPELIDLVQSAGFEVISTEVTRIDHDLIWLFAMKKG